MSSGPFDLDNCRRLLRWYHSHGRDLPWRHTTDPYHIWISEIMLQQTQVKTVLPRYDAWFKRFPDIDSLARSSIDTVLKAWEGLGYYRRARLLHAAAQQVVERHDGAFPGNFDAITALPGIGRSTAGAIASICFGHSTPVLDGNVKRVLKRWYGNPESSDKQLWTRAEHAIDQSGHPADWNQAMMELGATLCTPRNPDCSSCPLSASCAAAFTDELPTGAKRVKVRDVHWRVDLIRSAKGIWLSQRPDPGIWAGLWTPPITELETAFDREPCHIHLLTHRRLHLYTTNSSKVPTGDGEWASDLSHYALPTGIRRLLEKHKVSL